MPRWTQVSPLPNSPEAKAFRTATLRHARRAPVLDRTTYLQELCRGKRVLDVGVVAHAATNEAKAEWLHRSISQAAAYCLGVDILEQDVLKLQAAGYNVRHFDITTQDLGERFDLVVIGEVIEHLGSPEKLFAAAKRLLSPGGRIVMTTPNPYYWKFIRNAVLRTHLRIESVDHVAYLYPSSMAELAEREDLALNLYRGVWKYKRRFGADLGLAVRKCLTLVFAPEFFCETMVYEITNPADAAAPAK